MTILFTRRSVLFILKFNVFFDLHANPVFQQSNEGPSSGAKEESRNSVAARMVEQQLTTVIAFLYFFLS